ncbi:MAG: hypothetical protein FWG23_06580 [Eggerthellaceae bacterium]|jgi:hypothetical protein|nr:hypothetical protein [Eggerthellaceae bacterium]MDR2716129.1 hypothetical protein [Coriobacteriaceae bacterium]
MVTRFARLNKLGKLLLGLALCFSLVPLTGAAAWADEGAGGSSAFGHGAQGGAEDLGPVDGDEGTGAHDGQGGADGPVADGDPAAGEEADASEDGTGQEGKDLPAADTENDEDANEDEEEDAEAPSELDLASAAYTVDCRAHVAMVGWQGWTKEGKTAGSTGKARSIEALNLKVSGSGASSGVGHSLIQWSIDPRDWQVRDANAVYNNVMGAAKPGAIVVLHDIHPTTVTAMERVIPDLIARGYQIVTVSELLHYSKVPLVPGRVYNSGK